ncbi:hypothetical protein BK011_06765 [Tenericutes bacterium MZ-XQ]|nr:hypothetical protein BK011_06765 [Tenericutes bacterium MZ-XQ]
MENKEKTVIVASGPSQADYKKALEINKSMKLDIQNENNEKSEKAFQTRKVGVPVIKDISTLKEMPEYKPLDFPGFKYATLIHGVPVVVHENGQMFIIQNTTHKKRDLVMKHINQAVKEGYVEIRELDKEIHFIDNQVVCDIKKMLKEQK